MIFHSVKTRCATSLAELLVVMSACTVVLTTSVAVIHRVMHTQSQTRSFLDAQRSALRLSNQFRHDVHQAVSASLGNDHQEKDYFLQLERSDRKVIEYQNHDGNVLRILSNRGKAESREEFPFPADIEIRILEEDSPHRLVLSLVAEPAEVHSADGSQRWSAHSTTIRLQAAACLSRNGNSTGAAKVEEKSK